MAGQPDASRSDVDRLTAERDELKVRLEKALDVRDNLTNWNKTAEAKIAALQASVAKLRDGLPDDDALRRATEAAIALYDASHAPGLSKDSKSAAAAERSLRVLRDFHDAVRRARDAITDAK